jgi:putative flippase GtrA
MTTALGGLVILALDLGAGLEPWIANAAGYLAGAALGLLLQKRFVFRHSGRLGRAAARFGLVWVFAFGLGQAVLRLGGLALPPDRLGHAAAQLAAMGTFTAAQFVLLRLWVFRPIQAGDSEAG